MLPASTEAAVRDPTWLAHRYDPGRDAIHFLHVPRELHRRTTFLTKELLPPELQPLPIRRDEALAAVPSPAPLHFIFHSAFCCSTLLARACDRPGWAMGLREPTILNDLVGWRRRREPGPDLAEVLDGVLTLLARPFEPGEAVVIKPSNAVNGLAAAMLALRPDASAVLLHAPLGTYLASVAKKGLEGRLWVRTLLVGLLDDGLVDLGFSTRDLLGQSDLQVAAVGWLAQQALFAKLVERFGEDRVRTLDSETLTRDPAAAMRALAGLFRLPLSQAEADEIAAGPAFSRHSKINVAFAADDRSAEHRSASETHAEEIATVVRWADAVAAAAGVVVTPPTPLLDGAA